MEQHPERTKTPAFLADLGKPTLRGIKKCPKCGTFNGTRGLSCKNKSCDAVFRDGARKQPPSVEAVRVVTGSASQVYSVRLRDRGPDYRGFAELCTTEGMGVTDGGFLTHVTGRCFVPSCFKGSPHAATDSQCKHIKLAAQCQAEATPHTLKSSVLNSLQVPAETKQAIWTLATESSGPLVQRITKSIMVVKCKASQKHNLGFLHVSFHEKSRTKGATERKFYCSCQAFRAGRTGPSGQDPPRRCLHFYACVCAFASDEKLGQEFSHFVNFDSADRCRNPGECHKPTATFLFQSPSYIPISPLLTLQDSTSNKFRKTGNKKQSVSATVKRPAGNQSIDESQVTLTFQDWLASVSERINQTMHYQFDGKPEPLVFHVPQVFFDCLQQRISLGSRKKRLPNSTTGFVRKDALPLGTFSKYTWQITNVLQVKQIFDTPEMPLEVTRSFTENRDGTYQLFKCPKVQVESIADAYTRGEKPPAIRPLELKTFLKVGEFMRCLCIPVSSPSHKVVNNNDPPIRYSA
uniref:Chromosome 2 open reading frame 42 n=1 Tax=Callorhinchus milii TaxID=7868 RepID=A0A4W3GN89_CALMI